MDRYRCALVSQRHKNVELGIPQAIARSRSAGTISRRRWCSSQICALGPRFGCAQPLRARPKAAADWAGGVRRPLGSRRPTIARRCNALRIERFVRQQIGLAWQLRLIGRLPRPGDVCGQERQARQQQGPKDCETARGVLPAPGSSPEPRPRQANRGAAATHGGADGKVSPGGIGKGPQNVHESERCFAITCLGACLTWGGTVPIA